MSDTAPPAPRRPRVAVVGGGVSGLAAAWFLADTCDVVVLEGSPAVGGKLRTGEVGPFTTDLGAESMLARRPEAVDLVRAAGLADDLVHPATSQAAVWSRGHLHPLPAGTVMGVPSRPDTLLGLLTGPEVARVLRERAAPAPDGDVSVGDLVTARVGRAVVDRLVEPLLGGVYAGHADRLSLRATVPALWARLREEDPGTLVGAAARAAAPAPVTTPPTDGGPTPAPVFAGVRGGVGRLPGALARQLGRRGAQVRTGVTVRALHRTATGWRLETGPVPDPEHVDADAVVLAVPPAPAARLLRPHAPVAAARLGAVETASVGLVAAVVPRAALDGLPGSGLLVPPVEERPVKAVTFASSKWAWVGDQDGEHVLLRASLGRAREEAVLQRDDDDLVALALADVAALLGRPLHPVASRVVRWGGSLPQYAVGHVDAVAGIRADVDAVDGLAVCGAWADGVGVPACVAAARAAADRVARGVAGAWGRIEP